MPVPCFLLFLCFRKVTQEIFSELDNSKAEVPIFPDTSTESKPETEEGTEVATPPLGTGPPQAAPRHGVGPSGAHRPRPSAHIFSVTRKPYTPDQKSTKSSVVPPPSQTRFGGQKSLFWHPAGTGNCPRSHLHRLHRHLHRRC